MNPTLLTQDQINRLSSLGESRRKTNDMLYDRLVHNDLIKDLIDELSEDADEWKVIKLIHINTSAQDIH